MDQKEKEDAVFCGVVVCFALAVVVGLLGAINMISNF
jgi:hypothetical protein